MKRRELIKRLTENGWTLGRNGANHDIYTDGRRSEAIPRHNEIDERLANAILKRARLK